MGPRDFPVDSGEDGSRLETFLRQRLGLNRPVALKALRKGWVRVDGRRAKGSHRLREGEVVKITNYGLPLPGVDGPETPGPSAPEEWVEEARAAVVHRADDLVVASKPAGRPVHKGSGHPHGWVDALGAALGQALTPVGRLDRDTSGLLALAPGRGAARHLFAALREGTLERVYTALVLGRPKPAEGLIDRPLLKQGAKGRERMEVDPSGQPARTRYRTLAPGRASLLRLTLETGRTHQIRAHLHSLGHPVLGDPRYGTAASRALSDELGLKRLFLHAGELRVPDPDGVVHTYEAPLPPELQKALERV